MKKLKEIPLILTFLSLVTFIAPANADVKVVTSIKPLHSLASYLMDGVGKPDLIVDGYASPLPRIFYETISCKDVTKCRPYILDR